MLKEHRKTFAYLFRFVEFIIILVCFEAAYYFRFGFGEQPISLPLQFKVFMVTYCAAWFVLSNRFHLYTSKRLADFGGEALDVAKTTMLSFIVALFPAFFIREVPVSRLFLCYLWVFQAGTLLVFRFFLRVTLRYIRQRGYNYRSALIVGRNKRAARLVKSINETPDLGIKILGFVDAASVTHVAKTFEKFSVLGTLEQLEEILRSHVVDEVFVFLPIKSFYSQIEAIVKICETMGVEVKIPTDLFSLQLARSTISHYGELSVIDLRTGPRMSWQLVVKRLMDIVVSVLLLVGLSPLFGVVALLIKMSSSGPVFFRQGRVGYNGRLFNCLKFRTMIANAEQLRDCLADRNEMDGPVFKIKDDPRVTRVGKILRKTSIDELPQFINVLKGNMSLVGPRPPIPSEVEKYNLSWLRRLSMKPGITCLWQVNGRNAIQFEKWMELDKEYIDNWSLGLDMKILLKTIPAVIKGSGAA
jgi:exopolysaccharide biosynthesis polyprenyl glycosylphosphotransferase